MSVDVGGRGIACVHCGCDRELVAWLASGRSAGALGGTETADPICCELPFHAISPV